MPVQARHSAARHHPPLSTDVCVIVPAHNEARRIVATLTDLMQYYRHVVVIDDGSSDETGRLAEAAGAVVIRHARRRGQGAALRTGIRYGLQQGAAFFVTFDGDGQHHAADIATLLAPLREGKAQVVLGSRFLGERVGISRLRETLLRGGTLLTWMLSGLRLTDTHNGLRAFSRAAAQRLRITLDGPAHASELLDEITRLRLPWREVPVKVTYHEPSSHLFSDLRRALTVLALMLRKKIFQAARRPRVWLRTRPLLLLVVLAIAGTMIGLRGNWPDFFPVNLDNAMMVAAGVSLRHGQGLTNSGMGSGGESVLYFRMTNWPPGFSLLVALFHRFIPSLDLCLYLIHALGMALFLLAAFLALQTARSSLGYTATLATLVFWSLAFPVKMASSETIPLALFVLSWTALYSIASNPHYLARTWLAAALFAGACGWRFAYWPLVVVGPLTLLLVRPRPAAALKAAGIFSLLSLATIAMVRSFEGPLWISSRADGGWHWKNWLGMVPFPAQAVGVGGEGIAPPLPAQWAIALAVLFLFAVRATQSWRARRSPIGRRFYLTGVLTLAVVTAMLLALSARLPNVAVGGLDWTYVGELRYYAPILFFLSAGVFAWGFSRKKWRRQLVFSLLIAAAALQHVRETRTQLLTGPWAKPILDLAVKRQEWHRSHSRTVFALINYHLLFPLIARGAVPLMPPGPEGFRPRTRYGSVVLNLQRTSRRKPIAGWPTPQVLPIFGDWILEEYFFPPR